MMTLDYPAPCFGSALCKTSTLVKPQTNLLQSAGNYSLAETIHIFRKSSDFHPSGQQEDYISQLSLQCAWAKRTELWTYKCDPSSIPIGSPPTSTPSCYGKLRVHLFLCILSFLRICNTHLSQDPTNSKSCLYHH